MSYGCGLHPLTRRALHIYRALFGFLNGHVLDELQELIENPDETDDLLRLGLHRLPIRGIPPAAQPRPRPGLLRRRRRTRTRPRHPAHRAHRHRHPARPNPPARASTALRPLTRPRQTRTRRPAPRVAGVPELLWSPRAWCQRARLDRLRRSTLKWPSCVAPAGRARRRTMAQRRGSRARRVPRTARHRRRQFRWQPRGQHHP